MRNLVTRGQADKLDKGVISDFELVNQSFSQDGKKSNTFIKNDE